MLDEFVRDFLIERVEVMLDSRIVNGYYTRLGARTRAAFRLQGGATWSGSSTRTGSLESPRTADWLTP